MVSGEIYSVANKIFHKRVLSFCVDIGACNLLSQTNIINKYAVEVLLISAQTINE